jgi:hypothetical protein
MRSLLVGTHLYVTTPSALMTFDVSDPARPVLTDRTAHTRFVLPDFVFGRNIVSDGQRLLEANILPNSWTIWDLREPGHPRRLREVPASREGGVESGTLMYQRWRGGLLEFRSTKEGLDTLRRLSDSSEGTMSYMAATQGRVYGLKGRRIEMFQ